MKLPDIGKGRGQLATCRRQLVHSSGRHLDSPFGFLETQAVPDLQDLHQELIRVAHENSLIRQKEYQRIIEDKDESTSIRAGEEVGKTESLLAHLKKIERLASDPRSMNGMSSTRQRKNKFKGPREDCSTDHTVLTTHDLLPEVRSASQRSRTSESPSPLSRSPAPTPKVRKKSGQDCFWCRKAGRWCGWCQRPQQALSPKKVGMQANLPAAQDVGVCFPPNPFRRHSSQLKSDELQQSQITRSSTSLDRHTQAGSNESRALAFHSPGRALLHNSPQSIVSIHTALLRRCKSISLAILNDKHLNSVAALVRTVHFAPGEIVFRQGDAAGAHRLVRYDSETGGKSVVMAPPFYVVAHGVLFVTTCYGPHGPEEGEWADTIATLNAGCVLGEHSALTGRARRCTVRAAVPCILVEVMRSHLSRALHDSFQDEAKDDEEERERARRARRAAQLLPMRAERAAQAARSREAVSEGYVRDVERRVFGSPLGEVQRAREWTTGVHARRMRREHDHLMAEHFAKKIQRALAGMRARRVLQGIRRARAVRLAAVIRIQRMFRGIKERRRMRENLKSVAASASLATSAPGGAVSWTLQWLGQVREGREEAELDLHEAAAASRLYGPISEKARVRRLEQARRIVRAVLDGKLVGLVSQHLCEDIGGGLIPFKAVERWALGQAVVQRRRATESEAEWEQRRERLENKVREAVLKWLDQSGFALSLLGDWRCDAAGCRQSDEQRNAEDAIRRRYFHPGTSFDFFEQFNVP